MTTLQVTERKTCRLCGNPDLTPLFSLGEQYVSNFVTAEEILSSAPSSKFIKAPLELVLCRQCTLVQLKHTAPQELLYSRHYWYRSGVTQTMRDALRDVTAAIEETVELRRGDIVLDIGSNDGTLLRSYANNEVCTVGFEPAVNLAECGREGVNLLINQFWSSDIYFNTLALADGDSRSRSKRAKVVTALGMFYDLEDPNKFIEDVAKVLAPDGIFVAQLMCLQNMLNVGDVGNICHEHLEYYSLKSLRYLFYKYGLEIFDIERNRVNGESFRLWVGHEGSRVRARDGAEQRMLNAESLEYGLNDPIFYERYYKLIEENRRKVRDYIIQAKERCKRIWVYGASTKGNVILQYYGLDHTLIDGAADRSPEKWGKYTIGTNIPILSEAEARASKPDYFLVLPYAFIDEFVAREAEQDWRLLGGRFIVPLPEMRIV